MKRKREEEEANGESMEIVWQTPANPPEKHDYILLNGMRYVRPYYFEFISHVKNRWAGKTVVDLFAEEFKGRPYDYYVNAVKCGRIQVDGEMVPVSYIVKSSQKISHFVHRHEPPVMASDVSILQKEPDVLTVCKPASVPVHPCGQYRKNTVIGILQAEHGLAPLFLHRLDRLVSGLLILATNASKADLFRQQIEAGKVKKQYIAKVIGVFPDGERVVDVNINYNAREGRSTAEAGNCDQNSSVKGKAACTKFTKICTDGTHSTVLCEPITGRTHQIRVHLLYTGHPIANDMLYLSENATDQSRRGMRADKIYGDLSPSITYSLHDDCVEQCKEESSNDFSIDPMCTNCPNLAPRGYDRDEEPLWLHCVKYSGPGWVYDCPYPEWAFLD
ncbi:RNA pseudouridine synthase 7-like isoform X2 [Tripterygium wilfordii]|uniref:RNA pseudouridine synthase 7-like isoform X2 n=1 Tax=Tripterygium wilfordii TaxID=458696 RepID=UPI0018F81EC2|nr:RNA pseudouridine synthase 7-like isoform X2 [Tripterygium wilfordii]